MRVGKGLFVRSSPPPLLLKRQRLARLLALFTVENFFAELRQRVGN